MLKSIFTVALSMYASIAQAKFSAPAAPDYERLFTTEDIDRAVRILLHEGVLETNNGQDLKVNSDYVEQLRRSGIIQAGRSEKSSICDVTNP